MKLVLLQWDLLDKEQQGAYDALTQNILKYGISFR